LFGCIDLLAVGDGKIKFIQTTSKSNKSARRNKMRDVGADLIRTIASIPAATVELWTWDGQESEKEVLSHGEDSKSVI
jgi:hypothetical protein